MIRRYRGRHRTNPWCPVPGCQKHTLPLFDDVTVVLPVNGDKR